MNQIERIEMSKQKPANVYKAIKEAIIEFIGNYYDVNIVQINKGAKIFSRQENLQY